MSGGKPISQSETRLEALQIQSSVYGAVIPLAWGVNRLAGNMLWYGDFRSIPHQETQGGKGGTRQVSETYTYAASVMMALAHGPITDVPRAWRGKRLFAGGITPAQIVTATETYVPGSSYTVAQAANFAAHVLATMVEGVGIDAYDRPLQLGEDFSVQDGVYTFFAGFGRTITIVYQYISGGYSQSGLQAMGLALITGELGQAPWSGLATHGEQNIGYSGLAAVAGAGYDLGRSASVENHNFEVVGPMAYHLGASVPDVDPALMLRDLLANARAGANFPGESLDAWSAWSDFCVANGLLVSPVLSTQAKAADIVARVAELTNTMPVWSGRRLKMVPRSDAAATGNGRTYTPALTPAYALDDECYVPPEGEPPVRLLRRRPADRHNHVRVEYNDRANQYNVAIETARDLADIEARGLRSRDIVDAKQWVASSSVARLAAQLIMQRSLHVAAEMETWLPWHYSRLEPGDLVTLADAGLGLAAVGARVLEIEEGEDGRMRIKVEEYPSGSNAAPAYPSASGSGYQHNYNVAPGNAGTPVIFEVPAELTSTGIGLYVAVPAGGANWGGAQVWASLDGTNYRMLGVVQGGARVGALNGAAAAGAASMAVDGLGSAQLLSGSAADAANLNTLCYVGGASPEYLAYLTATLTGAGAYTLSGLVHGAYGTPANAHADNDAFVRVDERVLRSEDLDPSMVGKTVHIKVCSFNVYGGAQQGLAEVSATTYTVTGLMAGYRPAGGAQTFRQATAPVNPRVGTVWVNTTNGRQQRWSGTAWEAYASAAAQLVGHGVAGALVIAGNTVSKVASGGAYNAGVYSQHPIAGACEVSFTKESTTGGVLVGLNSDPLTNASYETIDYAIFAADSGGLEVYVSGTLVLGSLSYSAGDWLRVRYTGRAIEFWRNATLLYQVGVRPDLSFYLDSSFFHAGATISNVRFAPLTAKARGSLIDPSTWVIGSTGSQPGFTAVGDTGGEDSIILALAPDGHRRAIWLGRSLDGAATSEGGWFTDRFPVDRTQLYRFHVWFTVVAAAGPKGNVYLGCAGVGSDLDVDILGGAGEAANPYFVAEPRANFIVGRPYLLIGFVLPSSYAGGQLNMGGIWDGITGTKVANGIDFKWRTDAVSTRQRNFSYYADSGNDDHWWRPQVWLCDGAEPSLDQLLTLAYSVRQEHLAANAATETLIATGFVATSHAAALDVTAVACSINWTNTNNKTAKVQIEAGKDQVYFSAGALLNAASLELTVSGATAGNGTLTIAEYDPPLTAAEEAVDPTFKVYEFSVAAGGTLSIAVQAHSVASEINGAIAMNLSGRLRFAGIKA